MLVDGLCFGLGSCTHRNGLLGRVWKLREKRKTAGDHKVKVCHASKISE